MLRATDHLAYLTADTPGTGGLIKVRPEDVLVDEQPLSRRPLPHPQHGNDRH